MANLPNSIWEKIVQSGWYDEIAILYQKEFPVEARSIMSDWIAVNSDSMTSFDLEESGHRDYILGFVHTFLCTLKQRIDDHPVQGHANFHYVKRMQKVLKRLRSQDRIHLFQVIRHALARERLKVEELSHQTAESSSSSGRSPQILTASQQRSFAQIQREIENALTTIQQKCASLDQSIPDLNVRSNDLDVQKQQQQQLQNIGNGYNANVNSMTLLSLEEIKHEDARLIQEMLKSYTRLGEIMAPLVQVHACVLNELEVWCDEQRLVALGKPPEDMKLENIEKWFRILANCFDILGIQLATLLTLYKAKNFSIEYIKYVEASIQEIERMRLCMMNTSLVTTKEPKQIIRTNTNFSPVRLVVLPFSTNMMITSVKVVFINQQTAETFFSNKNNTHEQLPAKSGDLKFGKGGVKVVNNRIEYQTMTVSKVSKSSKRGEQFVVEERFWLYFRVTVNWHGRLSYLYTTSLPISVTSHPIQEGKAWTYVLWFNAFPIKSRGRFEVPDKISWDLLIEAINLRFINLGKALSSEQKRYLKNTLFRGNDSSNGMVSKDIFCCQKFVTGQVDPETSEDGSPIKHYSFGEWLCCCLKILSWAPKNGKLAKYGIQYFWKDGKIEGFMAKDKLESLLKHAPTGTFIIRFPENAPDKLGLYYYSSGSGGSGEKLITQLYSVKDFNIKALQDRIIDSKLAITLYPNIDKERAFTKMSKSDTSIVNGYFTAGIQEDIPSEIFEMLRINDAEQGAPSPFSSHSYLSNYLSPTTNGSSAGSVRSENSSTTGSYTAYSPDRSTYPNVLDDLPVAPNIVDGINLQDILDDNDMDL